MEAQRERMYSSYSLTTLALDGVGVQRHVPAALNPGERTRGTRWTGGWVGPRTGLDTSFCRCRRSNFCRSVCSQTLYSLSYLSFCSSVSHGLYSRYNRENNAMFYIGSVMIISRGITYNVDLVLLLTFRRSLLSVGAVDL
jgi:hypothetical protein